jgi:hypothetical protein
MILTYVLQRFPAKLTNFSMWYLGLPLSHTRLKRIHLQYLEDKVAGKLVPWPRKHASMAGRTVLVKVVLSSVAMYFIIVLEISLEVLLKIEYSKGLPLGG